MISSTVAGRQHADPREPGGAAHGQDREAEGLFSVYEGYHKISHPEEITSPGVAFAIFGVAIVFEADELLVAAKVEFDPSLSVAELAAAIDGGEARVRSAVPIATVIYLEPDLSRPEKA